MDRLIKVFKCILITKISESFGSNPVVLKELISVDFNFLLLLFLDHENLSLKILDCNNFTGL